MTTPNAKNVGKIEKMQNAFVTATSTKAMKTLLDDFNDAGNSDKSAQSFLVQELKKLTESTSCSNPCLKSALIIIMNVIEHHETLLNCDFETIGNIEELGCYQLVPLMINKQAYDDVVVDEGEAPVTEDDNLQIENGNNEDNSNGSGVNDNTPDVQSNSSLANENQAQHIRYDEEGEKVDESVNEEGTKVDNEISFNANASVVNSPSSVSRSGTNEPAVIESEQAKKKRLKEERRRRKEDRKADVKRQNNNQSKKLQATMMDETQRKAQNLVKKFMNDKNMDGFLDITFEAEVVPEHLNSTASIRVLSEVALGITDLKGFGINLKKIKNRSTFSKDVISTAQENINQTMEVLQTGLLGKLLEIFFGQDLKYSVDIDTNCKGLISALKKINDSRTTTVKRLQNGFNIDLTETITVIDKNGSIKSLNSIVQSCDDFIQVQTRRYKQRGRLMPDESNGELECAVKILNMEIDKKILQLCKFRSNSTLIEEDYKGFQNALKEKDSIFSTLPIGIANWYKIAKKREQLLSDPDLISYKIKALKANIHEANYSNFVQEKVPEVTGTQLSDVTQRYLKDHTLRQMKEQPKLIDILTTKAKITEEQAMGAMGHFVIRVHFEAKKVAKQREVSRREHRGESKSNGRTRGNGRRGRGRYRGRGKHRGGGYLN